MFKRTAQDVKGLSMKMSSIVLGSVMLVASTATTFPAQQGISFGSIVDQKHFCQVLLLNNGAIGASADYLQLSSKQMGGSVGQAEVTASNASYSVVSVDAPASFTSAPADGDTGVTFSTSYLTIGATNTTEVSGETATRLKKGVTLVNVHLTADRVGSVFPTGNYSAEVTVRCE